MAPDDLPPPIRGTLERWHADAHRPAADAGQGGGSSSAEPPGPADGRLTARSLSGPGCDRSSRPGHRLSLARMTAVKTILVVDDEPGIVTVVRDYLEHGGFSVVTASDGPGALRLAATQAPDLVVLDLGLPGLDGLDVIRELRRTSAVPIIVLTARGDESDRIVGLELGADDYLAKPFSPRELVARVRAVLRRAAAATEPGDVIRVGDGVVFDVPRMALTIDDRQIALTGTEFQLLAVMARQPGRIFTRSQLLDAVHGVAFESYERAIDAHVKNIRRKIEPDPRSPRYLQTVYGVGYRFAELDA